MIIPPVYQKVSNTIILSPSHWRSFLFVLVLGAFAHLLMYGTKRELGLRNRIAPLSKKTPLNKALLNELVTAGVYFGLIVFPFRLIVQPSSFDFVGMVLLRTILPGLFFFFGMTIFIVLKYPASVTDKTWLQVRGFFAGLIQMVCLCWGMFP